MDNKKACFTGHRRMAKKDIPQLEKSLDEIICTLIQKGVTSFLCGGSSGFDLLAGYAVLESKAKYETAKLIMVLPCKEQDKNWSVENKEAYNGLLVAADEVIYVSEKYAVGCMTMRNIRLVENSDYCIAYLKNPRSGTGQTVRLAKEKGIPVFNLADGANP